MSDRLALIEAMIAKGSRDPFHWYARAMELRSLGRLDDALEAYGAVREQFGDYVPTYLMGGQLAVELGRVDEARSWLEQGLAVAEKGGDHHAHHELQAALDDL